MWYIVLLLLIDQHSGANSQDGDAPEINAKDQQQQSLGGSGTDLTRQKRCIVVQKQSGTHGDSSEGDGSDYDDEYARRPAKPADRVPHGARASVESFLPGDILDKYTNRKSKNRRRRHRKRNQDGRRPQLASVANMTNALRDSL